MSESDSKDIELKRSVVTGRYFRGGIGCAALGGSDCGCESAADDSELDETGTYLCDDGADNDGDSLYDFVGGDSHPRFLGQEEDGCREGVDRFLERASREADLDDFGYPRPGEFEAARVAGDLLAAL